MAKKTARSLLTSILTFATVPLLAQVTDTTQGIVGHGNLLVNPSFEEHVECPRHIDATGVLSIVEGWYQPTAGSADYYHPCGSRECGVPNNKLGSQLPHSGEAYCGIYCSKSEYREYLQTELSEPLKKGGLYEVAFYVSLSELSTGAVATIGALLTRDRITDTSRLMLMQREQRTISKRITQTFHTEYHPQVVNSYDSVLLDTLGWMRIRGTFTAQGEERFLTIGNFASADHSNLTYPEGLAYILPGAYYYIDDVSLRQLSAPEETTSADPAPVQQDTQPMEEQLAVDRTFILKEIYFDLDKILLLQQSYQELSRLLQLLESHPTLRIEIIGHTDDQGSEAYNQRLSEQRAKAVVDYLVRKGINPRRLQYKGMGESQPLHPNDSEEHRAQNRRVEFRITSL